MSIINKRVLSNLTSTAKFFSSFLIYNNSIFSLYSLIYTLMKISPHVPYAHLFFSSSINAHYLPLMVLEEIHKTVSLYQSLCTLSYNKTLMSRLAPYYY